MLQGSRAWGCNRCDSLGNDMSLSIYTSHADRYCVDNSRGNTGKEQRKESMTIGVKRCNNWIKSILIKRFTRRRPGVIDFNAEKRGERPNGRVLDLGCGKGGDIDKWNNAKIAEYVGVGE